MENLNYSKFPNTAKLFDPFRKFLKKINSSGLRRTPATTSKTVYDALCRAIDIVPPPRTARGISIFVPFSLNFYLAWNLILSSGLMAESHPTLSPPRITSPKLILHSGEPFFHQVVSGWKVINWVEQRVLLTYWRTDVRANGQSFRVESDRTCNNSARSDNVFQEVFNKSARKCHQHTNEGGAFFVAIE